MLVLWESFNYVSMIIFCRYLTISCHCCLWFGCLKVILEDELMDTEEKIQMVSRGLDEVVTVEDLQHLFEVESHPKAYIGVEPSG